MRDIAIVGLTLVGVVVLAALAGRYGYIEVNPGRKLTGGGSMGDADGDPRVGPVIGGVDLLGRAWRSPGGSSGGMVPFGSWGSSVPEFTVPGPSVGTIR